MKEEFERELIAALLPCLKDEMITDAQMRITMVAGKYEIQKTETSLVVYEGDANEQILKRFLIAKIARGLSQRTVEYYRNTITFVFTKIGKAYSDITPDDIRLYLAYRVSRDHVSKTTANNERRALSSFYTWLQKEEILLRNPMSKVEAIKDAKKKKSAFEQIEVEKMRLACRSELESAIIEILISTWARVSEIAQIKLSDINDSKVLVHGKGNKEREVFLTPKAQLVIERYLNSRGDANPFLFPRMISISKAPKNIAKSDLINWFKNPQLIGEGHRAASSIEGTIRRIGKAAGVTNAHPHRFRRTGATMALRAGMPLVTVSKILGHESIATTQIYLDISDKELEQSHEKYVI